MRSVRVGGVAFNRCDDGLIFFCNDSVFIGFEIFIDIVDDFNAGGNLAKRRVFTVQIRRVFSDDEELTVSRVIIFASCHGKDAALVRNFVVKTVIGEFTLDALSVIRRVCLSHVCKIIKQLVESGCGFFDENDAKASETYCELMKRILKNK